MRSPMSLRSRDGSISRLMRENVTTSKQFESIGSPKEAKVASYVEWTKREVDWYFAEDRFLFASDDEVETQRWALAFQWVLSHMQKQN